MDATDRFRLLRGVIGFPERHANGAAGAAGAAEADQAN